MKFEKKYSPIKAKVKQVNVDFMVDLQYSARYSNKFDTEDEAIQHAFQNDKWSDWIIVPVITFDNF